MKPKRFHLRRGTPRHSLPFFIGCTVLVSGLTGMAAIYNSVPGSQAGSTSTAGAPAAGGVPASATAARDNARATLNRTNQAVGAALALQQAARAAALTSTRNHLGTANALLPNVPNGLAVGGLHAIGGNVNPTQWTGAKTPTQSVTANGSTQVTIQQTAQQALLNWQTFNVGKDTTLTFDQSAGGANTSQWIAFNKISDPTGNPTQILGSIKADGQVYIINPNGIIFGGSSQVNAHNLTASSLPINDGLVERGLLNNPSKQFLFSAINAGLTDDTRVGDVTVEAGAKLTAPTTAEKVGGRIALIGANVTNAGEIKTPDGQTVLAAGLQVGMEAHSAADPSLRGLDVYVGAVADPLSLIDLYAGTVINSGLINAPRASVTVVGQTIQQLGVIDSSTSVALNGRVDLLANYGAVGNIAYNASNAAFGPAFLNFQTGNILLGPDSVTRVLPELSSTEKVVGSTLALSSQLNMTGKLVHLDDGAVILAPGGNVAVKTGTWLTTPSTSSSSPPQNLFFRSGGRIDLDAGSVIDVSGSQDVLSSVASNIVEVQLRGSELANSPLLRDGPLRGATLSVDITETGTYNGKTWIGTPLADVSGYANLVQRTVGELTTAGGTVKLDPGDAVVVRDGALINVAGGSVNYAGAMITTSRVVSNGQIFDVSMATPDRVYDGVYLADNTGTNAKWGVKSNYDNTLPLSDSRYQQGFVQGGNAGSLEISAGAMALDGTFMGGVVVGPRQRDVIPTPASLALSFSSERLLGGLPSVYYPNAPRITFAQTSSLQPLADFASCGDGLPVPLPVERLANVVLTPELLGKDAFGSLAITNPEGDIVVEQGVTLDAGPMGRVDLAAANLTINGSVLASGGSITLKTYNISPNLLADLSQTSVVEAPPASATRGRFTLGGAAVLDVAGRVTDDRALAPLPAAATVVSTGGNISITTYSADLASGSVIDVSGGAYVSGAGGVSYGNAGAISILAGRDLNLSSVTGGSLALEGELRGYSGATGGSLTLQAQAVHIGGNAPATTGTLALQPGFFDQGGFSKFSLSGIGSIESGTGNTQPGMWIADGTRIAPTVTSMVVTGTSTGGSLTLMPLIKAPGLRSPVALSFSSLGVLNDFTRVLMVRGDTLLGSGSVIDAGPRGSITVAGNTVELHGTLMSSGGSIRISGAGKLPTLLADPPAAYTTVLLGSDAVLDVSGSRLLVPDAYGRTRGTVLDGGTLRISGNVVAQAGSVLDVSGTSGILDLTASETGRSSAGLAIPDALTASPVLVQSNGGTINLSGGEMLWSDATLVGKAGGVAAAGGTLQISSGGYFPLGAVTSLLDASLVVKASGTVLPAGYIGLIGGEMPADGTGVAGGGRLSVERFAAGGFANLDLGGTVRFAGPVAIKASGRITAGNAPVLLADSAVSLEASYISLGTAFQAPMTVEEAANFKLLNGSSIFLPPTHGTASLTVTAGLIDVGYLSLRGFASLDLVAEQGDIRGSGMLEVAGDIRLRAGQVYAPTAQNFTVAAFDYQDGTATRRGSVAIEGSGTRPLPLSAGSSLNIYGSTIYQNGVLRAPFGQIQLGWDGTGTAPHDSQLSNQDFATTIELVLGGKSVTSVSAVDPLTGKGVVIPYGVSVNGTNWIDPRGVDITSGGIPQKSVKLAAQSVVTEAGSQVDIQGGGDLLAYRWVNGLGGTSDILAAPGSFAVLPGYDALAAPFAAFNASLGADAGYANSTLQVGAQVRLSAGGGLAAGVYTLLPARYALLPGAYLVTPLSGTMVGSVSKQDGSAVVAGYRFNGLVSGVEPPVLTTRFEVAGAPTVASRAEYTKLLANTFLARSGGYRLPGDSGQFILAATRAMALGGNVLSATAAGFRGGLIDISSPVDILIAGGSASAPAGTLVLDPSVLSGFGAESLLIGGVRSADAQGTLVTATTGNLTLDNAGSPLTGSEIILVANNNLTLAAGAQLQQTGMLASQDGTLVVGSTSAAGSGNAVLVRAGAIPLDALVRRGVTLGNNTRLMIESGASLAGSSVMLDSTALISLAPGASITTAALSLGSGRISLALDPAVVPGADAGLVLTGQALATLSSAKSLSLTSYSSIDMLGAGTVGGRDAAGNPVIGTLALHAAEIRGLAVGSGVVSFNAQNLLLDNRPNGTVGATVPPDNGSLAFHADTIQLGQRVVAFKGFAGLTLDAAKELRMSATGGLSNMGSLAIETPVILAAKAVTYGVSATGAIAITGAGGAPGGLAAAGLGSALSFTGSAIDVASQIVVPSGSLVLRATTGDVTVHGTLQAGGVAQLFKDQTRYTDGGRISLVSDLGSVTLAGDGLLDLAARAGGGNAGMLEVSAIHGSVSLAGTIAGQAGVSGKSGSFTLDVGTLPSLAALDGLLNAASFSASRSFRVRHGDVLIDGSARAASYALSADAGSVLLAGIIDASGTQGGTVRLIANQSLRLASGASINVSGLEFDAAGKGGSVVLESRGANGGILQLDASSSINLGIAAAGATSGAAGNFTGTLHLRAPRLGTGGGNEIAVGTLDSTITGASHIFVEGCQTYDLSGTSGVITSTIQTTVKNDASAFIGNAAAIENRILANQGGSAGNLGALLTIRPGVEIVSTTGDLTLGGAATSGNSGDWNLAGFRFGAEQVPGFLTLRAAGNLVFFNTLSDGFTTSAYNSGLIARNNLLPDNAQGWSYQLVSGADFSAADSRKVKDMYQLDSDSGSFKLGKNGYYASVVNGANALTSTPLSPTSTSGLFQVIRTGSGDIDIVAGRDIQLLNNFASIYTAGTLVSDPTLGGTFDTPRPNMNGSLVGSLGAIQQPTAAPVQYTLGGGNVTLSAGNDIIHLTRTALGALIADSSREMPVNWLYRRGYVNAAGQFGVSKYGEAASTTWWVDFTNFFEGVGALGGGNVLLHAGRDVTNVDAVSATNARMPKGTPSATSLVELGGGDVTVMAGRNIDAGSYYVERGQGTLAAGASITTNATRSPSLGTLKSPAAILDPSTWLATTLFAGKARFAVSAANDVLLGPVANPFLLPQGYNNTYWYKTWFSTYAPDSAVAVSSLGGSVTLRSGTSISSGTVAGLTPSLQNWFENELRLTSNPASASFFQPWLRLSESLVAPFSTGFSLRPGTLSVTAFSGAISLVGNLTLSPSSSGSLDLLAAGSIGGLQISGISTGSSQTRSVWASSVINLSDADPLAIPGVATPHAYQSVAGTMSQLNLQTDAAIFNFLTPLFAETGSTNGTSQAKQLLHTPGGLHATDPEPLRIFSDMDISGIQLFSAKPAQILAGRDIRDIAFYLQNTTPDSVSVVAAGRDLTAYDTSTTALVNSLASGNIRASGSGPRTGDIQIGGPGTLEVFAGRNLDLGVGANNSDGTGTGITSIGNGRNPYLNFAGADIIAGAGVGAVQSLASGHADFGAFISQFVKAGDGTAHLLELGYTRDEFDVLDSAAQARLALDVFYLVLRDTGRDRNNPAKPGYGNYAAGMAAIAALFPGDTWSGSIETRARDIRTRNGGNISLLAPGGSLTLASTTLGNPLAPPGIVTEAGGSINIFTRWNVDLGISRIFTLKGGDEIIWSTKGNIAAGSSSKTVQSAPPTRVLIDPGSADVKTDLAGLATGGGIGVLASVAGVKPGNVDLIAPAGTIDAGDAGIRVSGNLNIAAAIVVNAGNISTGGSSVGAVPSTASAPSVASISSASTTAAASTTSAEAVAKHDSTPPPAPPTEQLSLITVEVLGYGGGDSNSDGDDEDKDKDKE